MRYELYGLQIESDVPLPAPLSPSSRDGLAPDLQVLQGESKEISSEPPEGVILAQMDYGQGHGYTFARTAEGACIRFYRLADFEVSKDWAKVTIHPDTRASSEWSALLLAGNVITLIRSMMGDCVLHASAVRIGHSALAFVGASGMGKSTLAALLCRWGAELIVDDLARITPGEGGQLMCQPGGREIRLRSPASGLAHEFPHADIRQTIDDRCSLGLDHSRQSVPLGAIVIPRPIKQCVELMVRKLSRPEALFMINSFPRVLGWKNSAAISGQFQSFGRVAAQIPVFEAQIPWGPPFSPEIPNQLLAAIGWDTIDPGAEGYARP